MSGAPELFTAEEAAERLRWTVQAIKRAASDGRVPHTRIGRHLRFSASDLEQIVAAGHRPAKTDTPPAPARRSPARPAAAPLPDGIQELRPQPGPRRQRRRTA